ncbi:hypothetical protein CRG98_014415 [Punica granatum]|uniref:Uncharacterized protein n=1 Tax=Punica granatum TaxID=22663 RepID=A0A2I0K9H1_PUNGR|nr:hypothetical protein CRG98_014415 [Punica granatum]
MWRRGVRRRPRGGGGVKSGAGGGRHEQLTRRWTELNGGAANKKTRPRVCTPEFQSRRGTRARAYATWLGSVHLPGDARRTHVRRSRHLLFYDPKVEGW